MNQSTSGIRGGLNSEVVYTSSKCLHTNYQLKYISLFCAQLISEADDQVLSVDGKDSDVRLERSRVSWPVTSVSDVVLSDTESTDTATNSTELLGYDVHSDNLIGLLLQVM